MSIREEYEMRTEQLVEPLVEQENFELVDVEYVKEGGNWYLRVFIDKENGITIDDCEKISRLLSELLDKEDFISDTYILEVSSPGLGRQLKKEKDLKRSIGEDVEIKLYKAMEIEKNGKKIKQKELRGFLVDYNKETITIEDEETIIVQRSDIAIIRLALDF